MQEKNVPSLSGSISSHIKITEISRKEFELHKFRKPMNISEIDLECIEKSKTKPDFEISVNNSDEISHETQVLLNKQKLYVAMGVDTERKIEGFELLQYDLKSAGDHKNQPFPESYVPSSKQSGQSEMHVNQSSSKTFSESAPEYEIVNLTQVDLFEEFKTTIAKMRKVLNVLEEKKSLKNIIERNTSSININESTPFNIIKNEIGDISTQTTAKTYNQISTSTDGGISSPTKNESIMVQFPTDTILKYRNNFRNIPFDSTLFNYVNPQEKVMKRKKFRRAHRCKRDKFTKKAAKSGFSPLDKVLKSSMKLAKSQYHKCIVYHITQHKNAIDRCVGTPISAASKGKVVMRDTFSALHFGPIHEFPIRLNKHEIEGKRNMEFKFNHRLIDSKKHMLVETPPKQKSTTLFNKQESLYPVHEDICHRCKTQPSLRTTRSRESSFMSNTTTTANWFLLDSPSTLVAPEEQYTSNDVSPDQKSSSIQNLISRFLDEEFKTSGLKAKVSSSTMNLIKDQVCDKLNGINRIDIPDVMITVCVPLKDIVSKIKLSRKIDYEDKADNDSLRLTKNLICETEVQVDIANNYVNDNLQTIPEKMCRKTTEIYQQNKCLKESKSFNRLSSFKKIFDSRATNCSNINPFDHARLKASRIYFSEHSTSSPEFTGSPIHFSDRYIAVAMKNPCNLLQKTKRTFSIEGSRRKNEGFFLNLPPNRFKKKRAQISKLFDSSDSTDRKYLEEPKLLYHVHDSSFCSSSKTDNKYIPQSPSIINKFVSCEKFESSFLPTQQIASRLNIKMKPKFISSSDLPKENLSDALEKSCTDQLFQKKEHNTRRSHKKFRTVNVNTSHEKLRHDNGIQCENIELPGEEYGKKSEKNNVMLKRMIERETYFNGSIEEYSIVSFPKVRFVDEVCDSKENHTIQKKHSCKYTSYKKCKQNKKTETEAGKVESSLKDKESIISLYTDTQIETKGDALLKRMEKDSTHDKEKVIYTNEKIRNRDSCVMTQTSPNSKGIMENFGNVIGYKECLDPSQKKLEHKGLEDQNIRQNDDILNVSSKEEKHQVSVEDDKICENDKNLSGLMKDVIDICNTNFARSRDCIVELTLYNLIKQIVMDSQLSEQRKMKVESILANFMRNSKRKADNDDINIVESAIENLVKKIKSQSKSFLSDNSHDRKRELYKCGYEEDYGNIHKVSSKCKHHRHRHAFRHRNYLNDSENEYRKHHRRGDFRGRSKKIHKHHCDHQDKCDLWQVDEQKQFRTVEGRQEYIKLVQKLQELEETTKQLSAVTLNKPKSISMFDILKEKNDHKCNRKLMNVDDKPMTYSKNKLKLRPNHVHQMICRKCAKKPLDINYVQTNKTPPIFSIPRNAPKLPVTKIIINLSNLKLLTQNCGSLMTTSITEPLNITDSTEQNRKFINRTIPYELDNKIENGTQLSFRNMDKFKKGRKIVRVIL
ncbi:hypothetical protein HHI36_014796 [Cryptolaemus montrouzieri]|uniref:Uncharacterized protein n=1 Tax=Cryptolaemus montrouzieri TaxID=559131 RepID=A0ABD2N3S9_9CUCU